MILCTMNLKYWCLANRPSLYQRRYSAQFAIDSHVLSLLMWLSPFSYGKRQGNARVEKCFVVNSDKGPFVWFGQETVTYFLLAVTGSWFSPTAVLLLVLTCSHILIAGFGRLTQDTEFPSTSPGSTC